VLLGLLLVAPSAYAQSNWSFGFSIGTPPPAPREYRVPPRPAPDYQWIEGYWYAQGNRWLWRDGYWMRPPYQDAYWVQPYWDRGRFYEGYWYTPRGDVRHNRKWERDQRRDWDRRR
jgi:hypothetical protein